MWSPPLTASWNPSTSSEVRWRPWTISHGSVHSSFFSDSELNDSGWFFCGVWSLLTARPSPSLGLATLFPPLNQLSGARGLSRELYFPLYVKQQRSQRSQVPARMTVARLGHKQNICLNSPLGQGRAQCASYNVRLQTQCLLRPLRPASLFSFCYC